jgi:hypothetical protein
VELYYLGTKERKQFFFEKKNQKTFFYLMGAHVEWGTVDRPSMPDNVEHALILSNTKSRPA